MSARRPAPRISKKHQARALREKVQRRWILGGVIVTLVLMIGFIGYGLYDTQILKPRRTLIQVNTGTVTIREFQARVRLVQFELLNQYRTYAQLSQFLGEDPQSLAMLQQELNQILGQVQDPAFTGQRALDQLVDGLLIMQEASNRGISVSSSELDQAIAEVFGYYPQGTPTPLPSATPAATPTLPVEQTETPTSVAEATPLPTGTPLPTPTVYTEEAYLEDRQEYFNSLEEQGITEADFSMLVLADLYQGKLLEAFRAEVPAETEHALLRHILVAEQEQAEEILRQLEEGEAWDDMVQEFSEDVATKESGGDLGWLPLASIRNQYGELFYALVLGVAEGMFGGPIETTDGWHIVQVVSREVRPLGENEYEQALFDHFNAWLTEARAEESVSVSESWLGLVPDVREIAPELGS